MKLSSSQSLAGILEPVFAMRTEEDLGIGDTEGVRQMIDWCARHRLNILQTLPINELSDDNSPYNAISSLAIEPTTIAISPTTVPELAPPELRAELREGPVNSPKVKVLKRRLLEAAFESFDRKHSRQETERGRQFRSFLKENKHWLSDYALFRVLMEENGGSPAWGRWAPGQQSRTSARTRLASPPEQRRGELKRKLVFFKYVQWLAFGQWQALRAY